MKRLNNFLLALGVFATVSAQAVPCSVGGSISATANPLLICGSNTEVLTAVPTGPVDSIQWLRDGAVVAGQTGLNLTLNKWKLGTYSALFWCGGTSTASSNSILVNQATASIISGDEVLCFGETVVFQAPSVAGATYDWFQNSLSNQVFTGQTFSTTTSGNIFVKMNSNGCSKYAKVARLRDGGNCPVISVTTPEDPYFVCGTNTGVLTITMPPGTSYDSVQWFINDVIRDYSSSGLTLNINRWDVGDYHAHIWFAGNFYSTPIVNVNHFHLTSADVKPCPDHHAVIKAPIFASSARYEFKLGALTNPSVQDMTGLGTGAPGGPDVYIAPLGYSGNVWCKITYNGCEKFEKIRIYVDNNCVVPRPMAKMDGDVQVEASLYPNPSNGNFSLDMVGLTEGKNVQISVVDLSGRVVYQSDEMVNSSNHTFVVNAELATGVYSVQVTQEDFNYVTKAIVK